MTAKRVGGKTGLSPTKNKQLYISKVKRFIGI